MGTFALIHGAQHGAWSWELLIPQLEALGYRGVAMDLPVEDPAAGLEVYVQTVLDALEGEGDDVTVVGHSMAGMVAPIVADRRPVRTVVYLCGVIPIPGLTMAEVLQKEPHLERPRIRERASTLQPDGTRLVTAEVGRQIYYHDCPPDLADWAAARLRPTSDTAIYDRCPLDRFPSVTTASIVCTEDRVVSPEWSRWAARDRLGIDCIELPGGHAPMLSRPRALAQVLAGI